MTLPRLPLLCRLCSHRLPLPLALPPRSISSRRSLSLSAFAPSPRLTFRSPPRQPHLILSFKRGLMVFAEPPKEAMEEELEGEAVVELTEEAMAQIARAQTKSGNPLLALRVSVESGGCHGYQYKMEVTSRRDADDYLFQPPSSPALLLIDHSSLGLLSGATIDYATELIGSSFRVRGNPHASDKGGCGCGVSWELKE